MISSTFRHIPGIGPKKELRIWKCGILTWNDFLSHKSHDLPPSLRTTEQIRIVRESVRKLNDGDVRYFRDALPRGELWRLYPDFLENAGFLDIETTGLSRDYSELTLIGVADKYGYSSFISGENLEDFRGAIDKYDLIITFNGSSFDIPFIEHYLGNIFRNCAHIDLMRLLRRVGYGGGLKKIESDLGVGRPSSLRGLSGYDAVRMWRLHILGDQRALPTLIRYNAEDVASLPELTSIAFNQIVDRIGVEGFNKVGSFRLEVNHLPFHIDLIEDLTNPRY